jgi:hypothetical protein
VSSTSSSTEATNHLRASLQWLVGAAGATAAVIVAALQLGDLRSLPGCAVVLVGIAEVAALTVAIALLLGAARVLTLRSLSATEISNRELQARAVKMSPGQDVNDDVLKWLRTHRSALLGTADSVTDIQTDGLVAALKASDELAAGREVQWQGRNLDPKAPEDRELLARQVASSEQRLTQIAAAVHEWRTRTAYDKLVGKFKVGGWIFGVSVAVMALLPAVVAEEDADVAVTEPMRVTLVVNDAAAAGLEAGCAGRQSAVAIGGTLSHPVVVLNGDADCPPRLFETEEADGDVVVIPAAPEPS